MSPRDLETVACWIRVRASIAEVERAASHGIVGNERHTPAAVRAFRLLWNWSVPRYAGRIGARHDRIYNTLGADFLRRRHERANRICARVLGEHI